jgi:hypothetical protein
VSRDRSIDLGTGEDGLLVDAFATNGAVTEIVEDGDQTLPDVDTEEMSVAPHDVL